MDISRVLLATQDPDARSRRAAEEALRLGSAQPGFGLALARAGACDGDAGVRQLALVVLKAFVRVRRGRAVA